MNTTSNHSSLVKDNLIEFWRQCLAIDPNYHLQEKGNIQYTVTDINDPLFNAVLSSQLSNDDINIAVDNILTEFAAKKLSFCWWVDTLADSPLLETQLERHKFSLFGSVSGMMLETPKENLAITETNEFEIKQVNTPDELEDWVKPIQDSFHMSDPSTQKYYRLFQKLSGSPNSPIHFIATVNNKVVTSSTLFLGDKTAGIYNCATVPDFRGKGILSALTKTMINYAKSLDYKHLTLQASPMSVSVFKEHGFTDVVPYKVYLKSV